jgi:hypothetical protein
MRPILFPPAAGLLDIVLLGSRHQIAFEFCFAESASFFFFNLLYLKLPVYTFLLYLVSSVVLELITQFHCSHSLI